MVQNCSTFRGGESARAGCTLGQGVWCEKRLFSICWASPASSQTSSTPLWAHQYGPSRAAAALAVPDSAPRKSWRQSPHRSSRQSLLPASRPPDGGHCRPVQRIPRLSHSGLRCAIHRQHGTSLPERHALDNVFSVFLAGDSLADMSIVSSPPSVS